MNSGGKSFDRQHGTCTMIILLTDYINSGKCMVLVLYLNANIYIDWFCVPGLSIDMLISCGQ